MYEEEMYDGMEGIDGVDGWWNNLSKQMKIKARQIARAQAHRGRAVRRVSPARRVPTVTVRMSRAKYNHLKALGVFR